MEASYAGEKINIFERHEGRLSISTDNSIDLGRFRYKELFEAQVLDESVDSNP